MQVIAHTDVVVITRNVDEHVTGRGVGPHSVQHRPLQAQ